MSRSKGDIGWVTRKDGEPDRRYTMPQMLNNDGSRDRRFNLYEKPDFSRSEVLTQGRSQYYQMTNAPSSAGVYQLSTYDGSGRPTTQYTGMSNNLQQRVNEHGRGGRDNISTPMHQAGNRGMDVRVRYATADNEFEARAQELYLFAQRNFNWNDRDNGSRSDRW